MTVQLDAWGDNSIRIRVAPKGQPIVEPPIGALLPEAPLGSNGAVLSGHGMTHGNLRIDVDPVTGLVMATRLSDGVVLLNQTGLVFAPCQIAQASPGSVEATVTFAGLDEGELVAGLGEHGRGGQERKVRRSEWKHTFADSLYYGKSQGGDVSIPMYTSSKGYGFVWNSPALGSVDIGASQVQWSSLATKNVDLWISAPPAGAEALPYRPLLRQYADAVGHAIPMPSYTTGFIQCKDRYRNQTQVLDVARGYKQRGLPISMIVIDWFHWTQMGDFGLKSACWPDPQAMVDELRSLDIELMVTLWPYIGQQVSTHWEEYSTKGYLGVNIESGKPDSFWQYNTPTGNSIIDPSNPAAMNATSSHWYEGYGKYGIRAIWMDQSEPDHAAYISGGQWQFHAGTDAEMLPTWVKYWGQGFQRELESAGHKPGEYFILSRNGWAGTQAAGMALWSGDIGSNWDELEAAVTVGQGVGLSGIPLWTTDIGGYGGGDPSSADFQELVVRWFQFGAFCPLFRLHGHRRGGPPADPECSNTNGDNEVWNLAKEPAHYDAIVAVMELREALRPYVKQLNDLSVSDGLPMMRAMFLEFPADDACNDGSTDHQYMFGPDWLIVPVTKAGATTWSAYLPPLLDDSWIYWWNRTEMPSGWVDIDTSAIGSFPLFRRASAAPLPVPPPPPAPPSPPAPTTCEGWCTSADHCCVGTVSSYQHPSCAQGCIIARNTASLQECKDTCTANDGTCSWSIGGMDMSNCDSCPDGCDASAGVAECYYGCEHGDSQSWMSIV